MWDIALELLKFLFGKNFHEVVDIQQDPVQVYVVDGLWEEADNPPQTLNVNKHELEVQLKAFLVDSRFGTNIRFPYFHDQL